MNKQEQNLQEIPLKKIVLSKDNKRHDIESSKGFPELVDSIKAGGVRVPILVRKIGKSKFELRYGERRFRASKKAGLKTIPAIVHENMDDSDALDLMYIENKFRVDLKPMEEAEEMALLMERFDDNAKLISEKIGKSESWIRLRANIYINLIEPWKKVFAESGKYEQFQDWTLGHMTLLARLPENVQKELLDYFQQYKWRATDTNVLDLKEFIEKTMHLLSGVKWDLDDQTLVPKAGACNKCIKRTGHQPMLWEDMSCQDGSNDRCLDQGCYLEKELAFLERKAKELREKHPNLVYITSDYPESGKAEILGKKFGNYLNQYNYKNAGKKNKDSIPALVISGKGVGTFRYIKPDKADSPKARQAGKPTPLKERRKALDAKRWAQVLINLREKVGKTKYEDINCNDINRMLMILAALYGVKVPWHARTEVKHNEVLKIYKAGTKKAGDSLWKAFIPTLDDILTYNGPITQTPKDYIYNAEWIANLIGLDAKKMFNEVSKQKGFTEPKSWANLKADGTPKKKSTKNKTNKKPKKTKSEEIQTSNKRSCRICGCTDDNACVDEETGETCTWVEDDLCSNCAPMAVKKSA